MKHQFGIIDEIPTLARYQNYRLKPGADPRKALLALADIAVDEDIVVGIGQSLLMVLETEISGMHKMPEFLGKGIEIPTTPHALWCWIRGADRGDLLHKARKVRSLLADAFDIDHTTDAFRFDKFRDLTGYEDGTENPTGDDALAASILQSDDDNLNGSSFVAVQRWTHDLDKFQSMSHTQQNHTFGRDQESNEELDEAPESAHVKRTAQEDFEPEAFVVRRSMPWANETEEGLVFVAFGKSFDAFEALLNRMIGADDGIIDGLFSFTRPVTGSYFWCPPVKDGKLNLAAVL